MRALIPLLLGLAPLAALAACDRQSEGEEQAAARGDVEAAADAGAEAPVPSHPDAATPPEPVTDHAGETAPETLFEAPDGTPASFAQFRGRPLLVNLWATWCAPCIAEMPTLDRLAKDYAGRIEVLAVSEDMAGAAAVDRFFARMQFEALEPYLDADNRLIGAYGRDTGLPTTILYDAEGREVWRVLGAADWSSAEARALMDEAL